MSIRLAMLLLALWLTIIGLALAGCGGGGEEDDPASKQPVREEPICKSVPVEDRQRCVEGRLDEIRT